MRNCLSFIILISVLSVLVSCGFNVSLDPLNVNVVSNVIDSSALEGAVVGSVVVSSNCGKVKFEIQNGQSDLFSIENDGKITINQNRPQRGI